MPKEEYNQRLRRARGLMAQQGFDALLIADGENYAYFTGMRVRLHHSRPSLIIIPQSGHPVLILQTARTTWLVGHPSTAPWPADVRTYSEMSDIPAAMIKETLIDVGIRPGARVGAEMSSEFYMHITLSNFLALQKALPRVKFQDASPLIWSLRQIKSPAEITLLREACRIAARAYDQLFSSRLVGLTDPEVASLSRKAQFDQGAEETTSIISNARLMWGEGASTKADLAYRKGDMVWLDILPITEGYYADYSRAGVIGKPSPKQLELQERIYEITMLGVDMIRPGVRGIDIDSRVHAELLKLPSKLNIASITSDAAGRIGHGMGLRGTELPSIGANDPAILQPGMVVTIEPGVANGQGRFHIEQNVLVTESGYEVLSISDWRLRELE